MAKAPASPRRALETPTPKAPDPPPQRRRRRWRLTEAGVAAAAFMLSFGVFLLGGLQSLRGSEIVALPPDQIILYRDAPTPDSDVLVVAVEAALINTAGPAYGDVAVETWLEVEGQDETRFAYEARVEPVYTHRGEDRSPQCPIDARCISAVGVRQEPAHPGNTGLLVIERPRDLVSVPGGSARLSWMSFPLSNCEGDPAACARYASFGGAVRALRRAPDIAFQITLDFHSDGAQTMACRLGAGSPAERDAFFDFLEERGWATLRCQRLD